MGKGAFHGETILHIQVCLECMEQKHPTTESANVILLIVLGARFSDRVTGNAKKFAKNAKILQIDVDAAEINKNVLIDRRCSWRYQSNS